MKKVFLYINICFVLIFAGCEDVLEPKIDGDYGDEFAWKNPDKAQGVLMNAYDAIPKHWDTFYGGYFLDVATDNAVAGDLSSKLYNLTQGGLSGSNNPLDNWETAYTQFNNINLFLEKGLGDNITYKLSDKGIDKEYKKRLKGEAYFLRAWWGSELLRVYGGLTTDGEALGYKIVTQTATPDPKLTYVRNSYEDCIGQILTDCDSAIANLPIKYQGSDEVIGEKSIGRADRRSALALKSRMALYAASPAYQPKGSYAITTDSIDKKWKRTAQLSQTAITSGNLGSYSGLVENNFNGVGATPEEFLFRKFANDRELETRNYPPLFRGRAQTLPSQNFVNAFPDINGFPITDARATFDPNNPYSNRDPRMALNVYYNGRTFDNRPLEIYTDVATNAPASDAPGYDYKNTRSGYYLRKWLSKKSQLLSLENAQTDFHMHVLLRKSEIYLNYAEASNELVGPKGKVEGCSLSAYDIVKMIRVKAGIKGSDPYLEEMVLAGKDAFRQMIMNERRLELAFENHRYFDLRRCLLPLDETITGVMCLKKTSGLEYKDVEIESRKKLGYERYYYAPLPHAELVKNSQLKNNIGWGK